MKTILDKDRNYEEKMMDALLKHAAEVAESELVDEATDERPVEFSARHEKQMEELFRAVRPGKPRLIRPKRIMILVAALIALFAVGTVALKPTIMNFFLKTSETNTEIRFGEEEPVGDTYETEDVTLGYVPAGMQMVENIRGDKAISFKFQNGEKFFQFRAKKELTIFNSDNENSITEKIWIHDKKAYLQEKDDNINLKWHREPWTFMLMGNLEKEEIIKIAENIQ